MLPAADTAEAELLADAARRAGSDNFGGLDFLTGFRRLLAAIRSDLEVDPAAPHLREWLLRPLVARLYTEKAMAADPAAADRPIVRPLFITGVPRTGTTALHQLIAANPAFQIPESWLLRTPMRRPPRENWEAIPEYRDARAEFETKMGSNAGLRAAHLMAPEEPDECARPLAQSFVCNAFGSRLAIPSYDAWWQQQDQRQAYRRLARTLRVIGGGSDKRWLLKNPSHILALDELFDEFPGAYIVHLHRDPLSTMPSLWSLLSKGRPALEGRPTDLGQLAERELALWSEGVERVRLVEERCPGRVLTVLHADLAGDPIGTACRIHDFAGQAWDETAASAIRAWVEANPAGRHGVHDYSAQDFGVGGQQIGETFRAYRQRLGFAKTAEHAAL